MKTDRLIIGSRGSDLALWQANFIKDMIFREVNVNADIKIIKTAGDKISELSFDKMEGKGFFTKELEDALLDNEIDLAVHSLKDLMTTQPVGLKLGAVGFRADRSEALVMNKGIREGDELLPIKPGSIIGTSSPRRKCQIAFHAPTLTIKDLRGNVPTRIRKLRERQYDAILIASAGIKRLGLDLSDMDVISLNSKKFLPAPAQGILGIQIRDDDKKTEKIVGVLNSAEAAVEASLERGLLAKFQAGCSLPLGVYSSVENNQLGLKAVLGEIEGDRWTGLSIAEAAGEDSSDIIEKVYKELTSGTNSFR